eukprot:c25799_g1_i1 orf=1-399(-)
MFSTISKKLARNDAFSLIRMMDLVRDSYTPQPKVHHLTETYDFRRFVYGVEGEECCIKRLNDLSFQHQFLIKRKDCNKSFLYGKQYACTPEWSPCDGLPFLSFVPTRNVTVSRQEPLLIDSVAKHVEARGLEI